MRVLMITPPDWAQQETAAIRTSLGSDEDDFIFNSDSVGAVGSSACVLIVLTEKPDLTFLRAVGEIARRCKVPLKYSERCPVAIAKAIQRAD